MLSKGIANKKTLTDLNFPNKLTETEWIAMRECSSVDGIIGVVSLRAWLNGITNHFEPTLYHMVSLIAYLMHDYEPNQDKTKDLMERVGTAIRSRGKRSGE